jgi:isopentenyldiphosphate isomerase
MKIPIVNEQDEILYYKEREETTRDEIRRIVSLYVFNEKNEVLIAKRHSSKTLDPNLWGPAVAGTVGRRVYL